MSDIDFKKVVADTGIPTTQTEMEAVWKAEVVAQGSTINNDSEYSPFWRLITAIVTTPALWLVNYLITHYLPNSFLKTAKDEFIELIANGRDVERKAATKAQGYITFYRVDGGNGDITIPVGTEVYTTPIKGISYSVFAIEEVTLLDGETETVVLCEAESEGKSYNLATGYYALLREAIGGIERVSNEDGWLVSLGADVEDLEDLRLRAKNQFGTLAKYHTDAVYKALLSSFPGIGVDDIYFEWDAPRGPFTANAYILLDVGNPSTEFIGELNNFIMVQGNHGHADDLEVFAMPETQHDLAVGVWLNDPNMTQENKDLLQSEIEDFIQCAFRQNNNWTVTKTKPLGLFSMSRLMEELHIQFPQIKTMVVDIDDIVAALDVPRLNSLTVTMND